MIDLERVVFDCNTLLQALAAPRGPAGQCVQLVFDEKVELFLSPHVLAELRDVTSRPRVVAKLKLTPELVQEFFESIQGASTLLSGFAEVFVYQRDPDDAHYINLAIAADAKLIVSRDRDLLDLMDSTKPEANVFQLRFPNLRILDPVKFLEVLGTDQT